MSGQRVSQMCSLDRESCEWVGDVLTAFFEVFLGDVPELNFTVCCRCQDEMVIALV